MIITIIIMIIIIIIIIIIVMKIMIWQCQMRFLRIRLLSHPGIELRTLIRLLLFCLCVHLVCSMYACVCSVSRCELIACSYDLRMLSFFMFLWLALLICFYHSPTWHSISMIIDYNYFYELYCTYVRACSCCTSHQSMQMRSG